VQAQHARRAHLAVRVDERVPDLQQVEKE
jgi:hypothetical protein